MKTLIIGFIASTFLLTACGGGKSNGNDSPPQNSSSAAISSVAPSSVRASSSSKSSSSLYCPANNSFPDCPSTTWSDDYCTLRGPSLCLRSSSSSSSSSVASSSSSSSLSSSSQSSVITPVAFTLTSTSFVDGSPIPNKYSSCSMSQNISTELKWEITSDDVKSFTLIMEDSDATPIAGHPYVHWAVYNIPGSTREIAEGATGVAMPTGSVEGANDDGDHRYGGPCPPYGTHHYHFTLYAINKSSLVVNTALAMQQSQFENAHAADIIQKVEIVGLFSH